MKNMIAIHKRLRKTFKRRLLQIMKKLNPKIYSKFISSEGMSELQLFEEQLNFLKQVQYRRIHRYEDDFNEDPRIGRALSQDISPHSIEQKWNLLDMQESARVKSMMKTYDLQDSEELRGVSEIYFLYSGLIKNDNCQNLIKNYAEAMITKT